MPYIGRGTDKLSNVEVLDNITFDGSSSYTLQKGGSNFTPSSANNILISIDGVVQAGNFTVSSSTIDFGTAVAGTSTCDFILHYGTGLITTPADGTVTEAKIGSGAVTSSKLGTDVSLGKVLQVVQTVFTGAKSTSSTSLVDVSGASVSITPSSTSSKVLVLVNANDVQKNNADVYGTIALLRGSTEIAQLGGQIGFTGSANYNNVGSVSGTYLDSPATTSATTFKLQFKTSGGTFYINTNSGTESMITVMEISA